MALDASTDTNKPKILIWVGGWKGGAERIMLGIAEILKYNFGIIPTLGVFEKDETIEFPQIVVRRVLPKRFVAYNSIWASLYLSQRGILKSFDVVITHTGGFWKTGNNVHVYHEAADLRRMLRNLNILSKIVYFPAYLMALYSLQKADIVFSASPECSEFLNTLGVRHKRSSSFVDTRIFRPLGLKRKNIVIFVGRADATKNLNYLINAVLSIGCSFPLWIAGVDGNDNRCIKFLGWLDQTELSKVYNIAKVFVLPSLSEGFPITMLEALSCKTPVVASIYATPEPLRKFVFLFDPHKGGIDKILLSVLLAPKSARKHTHIGHQIVLKYSRDSVLIPEISAILEFLKLRKY